MLGSKKTKLSTQGSDKVETIIGQHVLIHGDLSFSGGLYIEGRIIGKVVAEPGVESLLTLAQGGTEGRLARTPVGRDERRARRSRAAWQGGRLAGRRPGPPAAPVESMASPPECGRRASR